MHRNHDSATPVSRREFVKSSAAAAAGASLLAALPLRAQAPVAGSGSVKVGLIGCGGRGSGAAIQALSADGSAVLHAAADAFQDRIDSGLAGIRNEIEKRRAEDPATRCSIDQLKIDRERCFTGFDGYRRVIDACDVVILTTPPHFRPMQLRAAVDAGKHVFCEKPVAVDGPGVRSVLESAAIARAKKTALVSGFCWRYAARDREAMQRVHDGAIGDIRAVYTTYNAGGWVGHKPRDPRWSDMEYQLRNWHYFCWLSGDHLVEQACHSIDKMAWAMSPRLPLRCTAIGGRQVRDAIGEPGDCYDHFSVTYEFDGGVRGFHMCRHIPNSPFDNSDVIYGTRGTCRINGWADEQVIEGEKPWRCQTPKGDMYQNEHDELFASIRGGEPMNDGEWMAHSTLMAIMGRMAAYTGQTVTWEQALDSPEVLRPAPYEWGEVPVFKAPIPGVGRTM